MPMSKKREMITMNTKTMARTQYESPNDYIQYLVSKMKYTSIFCHTGLPIICYVLLSHLKCSTCVFRRATLT